MDEAMFAEAVETAEHADIAVVFAGLPDAFESEGYESCLLYTSRCV